MGYFQVVKIRILILLFFIPLLWTNQPLSKEKKLDKREEEVKESIWKHTIIENFEKIEEKDLAVKSSGNAEKLPELTFSTMIFASIPASKRSLMLRFTPGTSSLPVELLFREPKKIFGFITDLEFHVYSTLNSGRLYFYLMDTRLEMNKILITRLKFTGWKKIKVRMEKQIYQHDLIFGKKSSAQFYGFLYDPDKNERTDKEELLVIDEVYCRTREKFKMYKTYHDIPY